MPVSPARWRTRAWLTVVLPIASLTAQSRALESPVRFLRSDVEALLPQSSVYAMLQDRAGFLWFATREGIGRWDGYEMRTWKARPFADDALPDNVVRHIAEDGEGNIWMVAVRDNFESTQLARLIGPQHERAQTFTQVDAIPVIARDGNVFVVDRDSVYRFDRESARLRGVTARIQPGLRPIAATFDRRGALWITVAGGAVERVDLAARGVGRTFPLGIPATVINMQQQILEDRDGALWITGWGLWRFDHRQARFEHVTNVGFPSDTIDTAGIIQDPDGFLWLAGSDAIYRFDPALTRVERHALPGSAATAGVASVVSVFRDRAGSIWVGTVLSGLHRYDPAADRFGLITHDPHDQHSLSRGIVLPLHEDPRGFLWAGTLGGGLNRIDPRTGRVQRFNATGSTNSRLPHPWVWSLAETGDGRIWVGTQDGLAMVDPRARAPVRRLPLDVPDGAPSNAVYSLLTDSSGGVWIGTGGWLLHRTADGRTTRPPLPFFGTMHAMRRHGDTLWIGTSVGLVRFVPTTGAYTWYRHDPHDTTSLSHDVVLAVHIDRRGSLWAATNAGLNRFDPRLGAFRRVATSEHVAEEVVYSILEADDGRLWIGTSRGLVRIDVSDRGAPRPRVRRFASQSGSGNLEFNRSSALRAADGTFYFGGDRGITVLHPNDVNDNAFRPPVVVTRVEISRAEGTRIISHVGPATPIVLAPDDFTATFTFAALNFTHSERNQYAYRLEGAQPHWTESGTRRTASFTDLRPGRYTFRVRGSNDAGLWSDADVAIPVIVQPHLWETTSFRAVALTVLLGVVSATTALALRNRDRRLLAEAEAHRALEAERSRISRDMHDEVGAGLTEITMLSRLASTAPTDVRDAALVKLSTRARGLLDALGEIVWTINAEHDRAESVAPYLRAFTAEFLENAGLEVQLDFATEPWRGPVSAEFRRNLFLVLKEALTNVVRHAKASSVVVRLHVDGVSLTLDVVDDGCGISEMSDGAPAPPAGSPGHEGLRNLRRRAEALGGTLHVESRPGEGTRVRVSVSDWRRAGTPGPRDTR